MDLTSLTYTSLARLDLQGSDLDDILGSSRKLNALSAISGLLIFNGTHFLQTIEGSHHTIADLLDRLRRDARHSGLEVRDERRIEKRSFPGWQMEFVQVNASYFKARETISERLPETVPDGIKLRLLRMTELISTMEFD